MDYSQRWKLVVNTNKNESYDFRKGGCITNNLMFYYNNNVIQIVSKFTYLGFVFTPGAFFSEAQDTLSGQALIKG